MVAVMSAIKKPFPENTAVVIPDAFQAFAAEFVALAVKHGMEKASVTLRQGWRPGRPEPRWDTDVNISWEQGRHGEDARRWHMSTTLMLWGEVATDPAPSPPAAPAE